MSVMRMKSCILAGSGSLETLRNGAVPSCCLMTPRHSSCRRRGRDRMPLKKWAYCRIVLWSSLASSAYPVRKMMSRSVARTEYGILGVTFRICFTTCHSYVQCVTIQLPMKKASIKNLRFLAIIIILILPENYHSWQLHKVAPSPGEDEHHCSYSNISVEA